MNRAKKHPCADCRFCQWCADERCDLCRGPCRSKPAPVKSGAGKVSCRDEILHYVEQHGVRDKDAGAAQRKKNAGNNDIARTRKGRFRKTIDLHGMISIQAERALADALAECKRRGITELLIIHGRGAHSDPADVGVLKKLVHDSLEFRYAAAIRNFGPALPRDGGEGATLARL